MRISFAIPAKSSCRTPCNTLYNAHCLRQCSLKLSHVSFRRCVYDAMPPSPSISPFVFPARVAEAQDTTLSPACFFSLPRILCSRCSRFTTVSSNTSMSSSCVSSRLIMRFSQSKSCASPCAKVAAMFFHRVPLLLQLPGVHRCFKPRFAHAKHRAHRLSADFYFGSRPSSRPLSRGYHS